MTHAVAHILEKAKQLSAPERAELTDCLVECMGCDIPNEISDIQIAEVCRRIKQIESGEVFLIPGKEALEHVRELLTSTK